MARDPRKNSAYDSGLRGRERAPSSDGGGSRSQNPGGKVGDPDGVGLSAYTSGMRGPEKPQQKSPEQATESTGPNSGGGPGRQQGPNSSVGTPKGETTANGATVPGQSMKPGAMQGAATDAYKLGAEGNNTEAAAAGEEPEFHEDDTHVNIRVPKARFQRKSGGMANS